MRTIDSMMKLYDQQSHLVKHSTNRCVVTEIEKSAHFKVLDVNIPQAEIYQLDTSYLESMPCITTRLSSRLLDKNCDGVLCVYDAKDEEHVVMLELKSGFSTQELEKAFKQLLYTFFKLHVVSSLCEGYDADKCSLDLVLACQCMQSKDQEAGVWKNITEYQQLGYHIFKTDILPSLIESGVAQVKMKDIGDIAGLALNESLLDKSVSIHLVVTDIPTDSQKDVEIKF